MNTMNIAIKHNNTGISILQQGHHEVALTHFRQAAQIMYATTQEIKKKALSGVCLPASGQTSCETHPCLIKTSNSFIRSTPLLLSYTDNESISSCTVESATILMNMALCYHLDSEDSNMMKDSAENALTLYQMSYSLGVQSQQDDRSHELILTSLNNMGQLYHELGNFEKAQLYLSDLSTYMTYLSDNGLGCLVQDRVDFMLNTLVLRNPHSCAGAA